MDFLVEFAESHSTGAFDRYFGLKEEVERLFQRPVDLVEIKAIKNPYFRQAIEQDISDEIVWDIVQNKLTGLRQEIAEINSDFGIE